MAKSQAIVQSVDGCAQLTVSAEGIKATAKIVSREPGTRPALLTCKRRLSFLEKCADAFVLVLSRKAEREQIHFASQTFIQI